MSDALRILVVDDEEVIRKLMRDILELVDGNYVKTAEDGSRALEMLEQEEFDVVFTDLVMPNVGGLELMKRAKERDSNIVVVIMTGYATLEAAVDTLKAGAADFMTKPILDINQVPLLLKKAVRVQRMQTEMAALRQINRMHEEFLALISHELRTPLTSIIGNLEAVTSIYGEELSGDALEFINLTVEATASMGNVVESLLLAADLQSRRYEFQCQATDLNGLFSHILDIACGDVKQPKVTKVFHPCEGELPVSIDISMIEKAVMNIIDNAVKFNASAEELSITLETRREGDKAVFYIRNDGEPISENDKPALFAQFHQAGHYMTRKVGGMGLGLPMARIVMQRHGGNIEVEDTGGEGVSFVFTLPLVDEKQSVGEKDKLLIN